MRPWVSRLAPVLGLALVTLVGRFSVAPAPFDDAGTTVVDNLRSGAGYVTGVPGRLMAAGEPAPLPVLVGAFGPGGGAPIQLPGRRLPLASHWETWTGKVTGNSVHPSSSATHAPLRLPATTVARAEAWICRVVLQIEIARCDGSTMIVVDDLDIPISLKDRSAILGALHASGKQAVVMLAARQPDLAFDLASAGWGRSYWVDHANGLRPLAEAVPEKKAA